MSVVVKDSVVGHAVGSVIGVNSKGGVTEAEVRGIEGKITIEGVEDAGDAIEVHNGKLVVKAPNAAVNITIVGNTTSVTTVNGNVTVQGDVKGDIHTTSGNATVRGDAHGNVCSTGGAASVGCHGIVF